MSGRVSEAKDKGSGGISVTTLVIASLSSLAAAIFIHEFWQGGAILGAAITPIIVSIVSELLRKPTDRVSAVVAQRRSAAPARDATARARGATTPAGPGPAAPREDRFGLRTDRQRQIRRRRLGLALATGLSAFALAAFLLTSTELVIGNPLGGGGGSSASGGGGGGTTIFGGGARSDDERERERTQPEDDGAEEQERQTPQDEPAPEGDGTPEEPAPGTDPDAAPPEQEPAPDGTTPEGQPPAPAPTTPAPEAPAPAPDPGGAAPAP